MLQELIMEILERGRIKRSSTRSTKPISTFISTDINIDFQIFLLKYVFEEYVAVVFTTLLEIRFL